MSAEGDPTPPAGFGGLLAKDLDPAFFAPDLPLVDSRAWPHLPFLFTLVAALKPRRALYLGLGDGVGFLALDAAAAQFCAPTDFCGVDFAPDDELDAKKALKIFHDRRFSAFSRLETETPIGDDLFDLIVLDGAKAEILANWRSRLTPEGVFVVLGAPAEQKKFRSAFDRAGLCCFDDGQGLIAAGRAIAALAALPEDQAALARQRLGRLGALWAERAIAVSLAKQFQDDLPRIRETKNSILRRFGNSFRKSWRDPLRHFRKAKAKR